jgi:hypothetical protein
MAARSLTARREQHFTARATLTHLLDIPGRT